MNPLVQLREGGQAPWLDFIRRDFIQSGGLKALVDHDGISGLTSNPSLFEKALSAGEVYKELFDKAVAQPVPVKALYETLVIQDIQDAADVLLSVYEKTNATDGYVSLEVSPDLAHDTEGTIEEARSLYKRVNRPNVMIKIPGTKEGLPAITQLISEGININVTLLFSVKRYEEAARAYIEGLTERLQSGEDISRVASVASFFISRIDTEVDGQLTLKQAQAADTKLREKYRALLGKIAIANAKMAYSAFQEIVHSPEFLRLKEKGASAQRLLWASTSTKNKAYTDLHYVESLIGWDTVNTLTAETLSAFRDHGRVTNSLSANREEAVATLNRLAECGIDLDLVTEKLLNDGIALFAQSFDTLLATLHRRRLEKGGINKKIVSCSLGQGEASVATRLAQIEQDHVMRRIERRDPTLWDKNPQEGMPILLDWLHIIEREKQSVGVLDAFAQSVRVRFKQVVLIGIGGSSLCPRILRAIFGKMSGFPDFYVIDSIVPASIRLIEKQINLSDTLFIVASKSGSTIEPMTLCRYFLDRLTRMKGDAAGGHFIAITDPGSPFMDYARKSRFGGIFEGVAGIGGRYSALSHFGMVPAAVMGIDIGGLLAEAERIRLLTDPHAPAHENPAAILGAILGQMTLEGKEKLTFISSPALQPFGFWLEQLIAESTGKQGCGIVPVADEDIAVYGKDRTFVYLRYSPEDNTKQDEKAKSLEKQGHPVIRIHIDDKKEVGGQFFLWSMATAVAGAILGVNPFDQPDVESSKKNTRALLAKEHPGGMSDEAPLFCEEGISLWASPDLKKGASLQETLLALINGMPDNHFIAINAYLPETDTTHEALQALRKTLGQKKNAATTLGYGPAYLHSSGQMHKGGPNILLALILTSEATEDIPIPEASFTFGQLAVAQAIGDFQSLVQRQRTVVRIHLPADIHTGLRRLQELLR